MIAFVIIIALYHTVETALAHATGCYHTMTQLDTSHLDPTVSVTVRPSVNVVALLGRLPLNRELHLPNDTLVLDSGASHHMVKDASLFDAWHTRSHVAVDGAGGSLMAQGTGSITIRTSKQRTIKLCNIYYVPDLPANLISVMQLRRERVYTHFGKTIELRSQGQLIGVASLIANQLSTLDATPIRSTVSPVAAAAIPLLTLHQRFGHLSLPNLRRAVSSGQLQGQTWTYSRPNARPSPATPAKPQSNKDAFPNVGLSRFQPLELVHSDVLTLPEPATDGERYVVTFIDDFSRKTWVSALRNKSQVFDTFQRWHAMIERSTGLKLRTLRTDNGGEYTSKAFIEYCSLHGITRQLTIPYTPEQNGRAERTNRTIALRYVVDTKNLSPHSAIDHKIPDTIWYGKPPSTANLRAFGCRAWHTTPRHKRAKLDPKAKPFIFVGIENKTKAWTLYDPETTLFFQSRDVRFDENVFPARDAPTGQPKPRATSTAGDWTFVDAAHGSRTVPRLSLPPVVHENRFAALETDASDDATIEMSDDGFDTPSDMSMAQFSLSPPASDVTDDSADPIDFLSCPSRAAAFAATTADSPVVELEGPTEDPQNWSQAVKSGKEEIWRQAAADEFHSLTTEYKCFTPVDSSSLPPGAKVLGSRFIFRTKRDQLGKITSHKGRLVAQGFSQRPGIDYDETFAPVAKFTSIRALIALAAAKKLHVHQADVDKAYLHGELKEDLYMRVPQGVDMPGKVLKLHRSIYGLKQAGRVWNEHIDLTLKSLHYRATAKDHCVYVRRDGDHYHYIALYVDDLLMVSPSEDEIERILNGLEQKYGIKRLGPAQYILGIQIKRQADKSIILSQEAYITSILRRFGMSDSSPASTPMAPNRQLEHSLAETSKTARTRYMQAIGCLLYAATGTRPDISYAVGYLARFSASPTPEHWTAIKTVFRYLRGTARLGLHYSSEQGKFSGFTGYSDADWGTCTTSSRSTMGYSFHLAGSVISWSSKVQNRVADSTTDAEYLALSHASKEAGHLQELLMELGIDTRAPVQLYGDNQGAIALAKNPTLHHRSRHIRIREHFVRDQVRLGTIQALGPLVFKVHRDNLGLRG
ncbi:BZ3500_MvSof-1268-A1-R1_C045g00141 [Microbotryum saponariae]|uniref:BZ3500_MvSof-1268-A1-R1_C045g00141 protein n=1 Tax=Microbotryum saponariae TaxID=289078 RepID=A0A2X0NFE6_9BASI|nr:BZ3500_MvSof-1268-A1-R1_C045g00141 [Microbotryum saponariae]